MFDSDLILVDGTVACSQATAASWTPAISTTRTAASGAVVIDLRKTGVSGLAAVLILPTGTSVGTTDYLIAYLQASDTEDMTGTTTGISLLGYFGIASAVTTRILSGEAPAIVVMRFATKKRYVRANLTPTVGNGAANFGAVKVYLTPYAFKVM